MKVYFTCVEGLFMNGGPKRVEIEELPEEILAGKFVPWDKVWQGILDITSKRLWDRIRPSESYIIPMWARMENNKGEVLGRFELDLAWPKWVEK